MKFPCTGCGACCMLVQPGWISYEKFKADGWILPSGACKNYDWSTRGCSIYSTRPDACRVDREQGMVGYLGPQETWFAIVESYCDAAHMREYGVPRERGEDCTHQKK